MASAGNDFCIQLVESADLKREVGRSYGVKGDFLNNGSRMEELEQFEENLRIRHFEKRNTQPDALYAHQGIIGRQVFAQGVLDESKAKDFTIKCDATIQI